MALEDYRLLTQRSAGRDGVAYRAEPKEGGPAVELRRLTLPTGPTAADQTARLARRITLAARLDHPNFQRVVENGLTSDPPYVCLELDERPALFSAFTSAPQRTKIFGLRVAQAVARAVASAHRVGLSLGRLDPWSVRGDDPQSLKIDPTGLDTSSSTEAREGAEAGLDPVRFTAPEIVSGEEDRGSPEADLFSLGTLGLWVLTRRPGGAAALSELSFSPTTANLLRSLVATDPANRLPASVAEKTLAAVAADFATTSTFGNERTSELEAEPPDSARTVAFDSSAPPTPHRNGSGKVAGVPADGATGEWGTDPLARTIAEPPPSKATMVMPGPSSAGEAVPPASVGPEADMVTVAQPLSTLLPAGVAAPESPPAQTPATLGRFRLLEKLGEGGMGEVYKAIDPSDNRYVALKVLRPEWASKPTAMARFRKEARLLAKVNNPFVTNLIEVNEDRGLHFIVLEYVAGRSLDRLLKEKGRLDEPTALAVAADVARGLMDAHRLGIVHRDIKPANILLVGDDIAPVTGKSLVDRPRVKLTDFGLARHAVESDSMAVTQSGVIVGTPSYMAPEQCSGGAIDARVDVYALGVTLFHLVAGRPPFEADDLRAVIAKHLNEPAPSLRKINPTTSEGLSRVVEKALAKSPDARYADAGAILEDLDRLLKGEPTGLFEHPTLPAGVDADQAMAFDFSWELESPPKKLWPLVSNTDRLDRALGFGAVQYTMKFDPARGVRRFLSGRKAGMDEQGEEHPYEWVEGRRLGVYREYTKGPFHWVLNVVELTPRIGGGTTLTHRLRLVPRGWFMRLGSRWGVGSGLKRDLERVYKRLDAALNGKLGRSVLLDPFETPEDLPEPQQRRLDALLAQLPALGVDAEVAQKMGEFVARAPAPELARIRPIALARRLGLPEDQVIAACLHGANIGLFVLMWDLLCPVCRVPSDVRETMKALTDHGRCEACQLDYQVDFASSVELVFRSHPQVREADTNLYCAAGPFHLPHVVAQVRLRPEERLDLDLDLNEGDYKLRGPQLGWALDFRVRPGAPARRRDLRLSRAPEPGPMLELGPRGQVLSLENDTGREVILRVERSAPRDDALTAARASTLALFRELFPTEVLAPGQLVSVESLALLMTALEQPRDLYESMGDARAFAALHEMFRRMGAVVKSQNGALVKTQGEGIFAVFGHPEAAVAAALALPDDLVSGETTAPFIPRLRAAVHAGPVMAANLNDQLDYFGATVYRTTLSLASAGAGTLVLTEPVASDPRVAERLYSSDDVAAVLNNGTNEAVTGPLLRVLLRPSGTARGPSPPSPESQT